MAGIAKAAGVSTGLLHYHFDTKERLFAEVLVWSNNRANVLDQEAVRDAGQRPPERLAAYLDRCLPSDDQLEQDWLLWQELTSLCLRQPELGQVGVDLYEHLYDTAAAIIDDGVAAGTSTRWPVAHASSRRQRSRCRRSGHPRALGRPRPHAGRCAAHPRGDHGRAART